MADVLESPEMTELAGLATKVASIEAQAASEDQLLADAAAVTRAEQMLALTKARLTAELESRGTTDARVGMSTKQWLSWETTTDGRGHARSLKVGKWMRYLPLLDAAAADPERRFGFDHASEVARVVNLRNLDALTALQDVIIQLAEALTFDQFCRELQGIAQLLDEDGGHNPDQDLESTKLTITRTGDGGAVISGQLGPADVEIVLPSLEARAKELRRQAQADSNATGGEIRVPNRAQAMGMALVDQCQRGDAIAPGSKPAPSKTIVRISAADPRVARNLDGWYLRDTVRHELCCDTVITPVMLDSLGLPLDVGRDDRLAPRHIRDAVFERDQGCRFPGCDSPASWVVYHHIVEWDHGGDTRADNLLCLCPRHHGLVHRNGWTVELDDDNTVTYTTPTGQQLTHPPPPRQPGPAHAGPSR